jgi:hypothetical protein
MTIVNLLDELTAARACLADVQGEIKALVPTDLAAKEALAAKTVADLEATIKDRAKFIPDTQAHSLIGQALQLVWSKGKVGWDDVRLAVLAGKYGVPQDELAGCKVQGDGWWSIRQRGKGK